MPVIHPRADAFPRALHFKPPLYAQAEITFAAVAASCGEIRRV